MFVAVESMFPGSVTNETWTPFDCLPVAKLTSSGLLEKEENEVELIQRESSELRATDSEGLVAMDAQGRAVSTAGKTFIDRLENLNLTITTHRIVLLQQQKGGKMEGRFLHLSHMLSAEGETKYFKSPKIILQTYIGEFILAFKGREDKKDRDDVLENIERAHSRQAWEAATRFQKQQQKVKAVASRKVGVDAILTKSKLQHEQAARVTNSAFDGDAETLLQEAQGLVKVIQKYVATLDKQKEGGEEDATRLADMLQGMGMTSALDKSNFRGSKDAYNTQLARQLADFLKKPVQQAGGLLTLTDVYCLYNRARGSNLISPDALLEAVTCMDGLNLGMRRRTFPSGLVVIQDTTFDDDQMAEKLLSLAEKTGSEGLTEMEAGKFKEKARNVASLTACLWLLGRQCHIAALLIKEELLVAEKLGYLCRDETYETIRFFPNRFKEWEALGV